MKNGLFLAFLSMVGGNILADSAQAYEPLVDVGWVVEHLHHEGIVFLDIRNRISQDSYKTYRQGHIPGAIYSDYANDGWRKTRDDIPYQMPEVADLENLIGKLGIDNHDHVVIIAAGISALDMGSATRVYFTFKALGHDRVSILDGGYQAYTANPANPIEKGWNVPIHKRFVAAERPELIANRTQVFEALGRENTVLLDMRPESQYFQQTIPTSLSLPESNVTRDGGYFIDSNRAGSIFSRLGIHANDKVISFCNTGHWASLGWFVTSEILGRKDQAILFDGSMTEWKSDPNLPVTDSRQGD